MLFVRNLVKIYINRFVVPTEKNVALRTISFDAIKGEVTGIIGDSGSGKTTILKCIGGLLEISAGEVYLNEKPLHELSSTEITRFRNKTVGYISQRPNENLIEEFTVYENLEIPLIVKGVEPKDRKNKINSMLEALGMLNLAKQPVKLLSGGEAQRVSVLAALIKSPKLLIADEPTGELDHKNSVEVFKLIKKVTKLYDCITIVVSHDPLIFHYCDRIYRLRNGVITSIIDKKALNFDFDGSDDDLLSFYFHYVPVDEFGRLCIPEHLINELNLKNNAFVKKVEDVLVVSSNNNAIKEFLVDNKQ